MKHGFCSGMVYAGRKYDLYRLLGIGVDWPFVVSHRTRRGSVSVLDTILSKPSCFQTSGCGFIAKSETLPKVPPTYDDSYAASRSIW